MKLTKTWLSYIIWGLFSIIFFTNIGIAAIEIHQKNEMTDFILPIVVLYGGTIAGIGIILGVYKLIEKFVLSKTKPNADGETTVLEGPLEWFIFALVMFVAAAVRVISVISAGGVLEGNGLYYSYAISGNTSLFGDMYSNGAYLYGGFLRFVLGFLGHITTAAMAVQAVLQTLTILVTYFMAKKALGRVHAWIAVILMAFLPGSFLSVRICSPDALFSLLFALYMLVLVSVCKANREQKIRVGAQGLFYILLGLFTAFLAYYDVAGLLPVVISIVAFLQYKNEDAWLKIQRPWLHIVLYSLSFVLGFVVLLWFLPANGTEVGPASLIGYVQALVPNFDFNLMILTPHKGQWDCIALFILAGLWFVGFLRTKEDKAFPYAFMIVMLTITSFLGIGAYEYDALAGFVWVMLATIGISNLGIFRKNQKDVEKAEKIKEDTKNRKEERERKRAEAAGEKSIRLDDIHKKPVEEPAFEPIKETKTSYASEMNAPKKSYGIGRKSETPSEEIKTITTVSAVEKPPVISAPIPTPIESKPSYSQGSRSRRALRSPSKSTFTQEDLERISRYTGMNYMAATTIPVAPATETTVVEEPVSDAIAATETYVSQEHTGAEMTQSVSTYIELPDLVAEQPQAQTVESIQDVQITKDIDATENFVNAENAETVENIETSENVEPEQTSAADIQDDSIIANDETKTESTERMISDLPVMEFKVPPRRHFRHPSKSTFSAEELERISQFTGVDYKNSNAVMSDKSKEIPQTDVEPKQADIPSRQNDTVQKQVANNKSSVTQSVKGNAVEKPMASLPERKPKLIRNPLPGPKPHVAKELNYDYNPKESEMKFDIEDLKGKDYFDL